MTEEGKATRFMKIMHHNLRFDTVLDKDNPGRARLNVNYEEAAIACLTEHMFEMKAFYEKVHMKFVERGGPIHMHEFEVIAKEFKIPEFIKEVS